jgi:hypothetical protein
MAEPISKLETSKVEEGLCDIQGRLIVRYSTSVLEQLRRLAVDAFNEFPHGGREIGGVLYGFRTAREASVLNFAVLECEHAHGPRFILSDRDRCLMAELIEPPAGLELVGWFRTHTRSGLDLDAHDRDLFEHYFQDAAGLGLVLNPTHWGPASAAFFVRERSGEVYPEGARGFSVEPRREPIPPEAGWTFEAEPAPGQEEALVLPTPPATVGPYAAAPESRGPASAPRLQHARLWAVGAAVVVAVLALYAYLPSRRLGLNAYAIASGQMRIEWNGRSMPILTAASGALEIKDGDSSTEIPLDTDILHSGAVTYDPRTRHVTVRLRIFSKTPGASPAQEAVEFVRAEPSQQPTLPSPRDLEPVGAPPPSREVLPPIPAPAVSEEASRLAPREPTVERAEPPRRLSMETQPAKPAPPPRALPIPPAMEPAGQQAAILPGALAAPSLHVIPPPSPAAAAAPVYSGPRSGRLIWTGVLNKAGVIEIDGGHANHGTMSGELPATATSVRVWPAEFTRDGLTVYTADRSVAAHSEAPGKSNGWNAVYFKFDPERARELSIIEAPNRTNAFSRLVVRDDGRSWAVVVVDWNVQQSPASTEPR